MDNQSLFNKKNISAFFLGILFLIIYNEAFIKTHLGNEWGALFVVLSIPILIGTGVIWGKKARGSTEEIKQLPIETPLRFGSKSALPGIDSQPFWWRILFLASIALTLFPYVFMILGILSSDYEYIGILGLVPLMLLALHKPDSAYLTDVQHAQFDKEAISFGELLILLGVSTGLTSGVFWVNAHVTPLNWNNLLPVMFLSYGSFAFYFIRRRYPTIEKEILGTELSAMRMIVATAMFFMGSMLAILINYLACNFGYCAW